MGDSGGSLILLLVLVPLVALVVFQRRTMKRQLQQVQSQLELGAVVMTHSGVFGTVRALRDDHVEIELAPGVVTKWARAAVNRVVPPEEADPTTQLDPTDPDQP